MKKLLALLVAFIFIFLISVFSASATDYSNNDIKFTVPDFLVNDAEWAESSGFAYAFSDSDVNMELNISVYPNEEYSYEGLDDDNLSDYAQFLREKYETGDYSPVKSVTVESCLSKEGVYGIRSDIVFENEHYIFYWYATEETCYDFNFYVYNSEFIGYVEQIAETFSISSVVNDADVTDPQETPDETMPVLSDDEVEADGDGQVGQDDGYYSVLSFPWPVIVFVFALLSLIMLIVFKRKKKQQKPQITQEAEKTDGIYFDASTGTYYKTVSPDENIAPGQPVGYIYYPVHDETNMQNK